MYACRRKCWTAWPGPLALEVEQAVDGALVLAFRTSNGAGQGVTWTAVAATLERADIAPGLVLAAHLVRAMGGCLQQAGAALRFVIAAAPADEAQAMPPPFCAHDEPPAPFGDGLTVLLREPHDAMRDYLTEVFDSAGFTLCYDAAQLNGALPALVVCADAAASERLAQAYQRAPRLLHALRPPVRPQDFAGGGVQAGAGMAVARCRAPPAGAGDRYSGRRPPLTRSISAISRQLCTSV